VLQPLPLAAFCGHLGWVLAVKEIIRQLESRAVTTRQGTPSLPSRLGHFLTFLRNLLLSGRQEPGTLEKR